MVPFDAATDSVPVKAPGNGERFGTGKQAAPATKVTVSLAAMPQAYASRVVFFSIRFSGVGLCTSR